MSTIACPHCQGGIENDPSLAGQLVSCPHCKQQLKMPQPVAVQAVKLSVSGQGLPIVDTSTNTTSTAGSRYRKRKRSVPVWAWIVGAAGVLFFCFCGLIMLVSPNPPESQREQAAETEDDFTKRYNAAIEFLPTKEVLENGLRVPDVELVEENDFKIIEETWGADVAERARALCRKLEENHRKTEASSARIEAESKRFTMGHYQRISQGRWEDEVKEILRCEGTETASSGDIKIVTYEDGFGAVISVTYKNRYWSDGADHWVAQSKAQAGL